MKTYFRCVWANKLSFTGYILFVIGIICSVKLDNAIAWQSALIIIPLTCGIMLISMTTSTYQVYKKALAEFQKNPESTWYDKHFYQDAYCWRTGIALAKKDFAAKQQLRHT